MNSAYGSRINTIGSSSGLFTSALDNSARSAGADAVGWGGFAGGMLQRSLSMYNAQNNPIALGNAAGMNTSGWTVGGNSWNPANAG
jgi:hypothetical protein